MELFEATLYLENQKLEQNSIKILSPMSSVGIVGNFMPNNPSEVSIPCVYDPYFKCFKADIVIKMGQTFRFHLDNGKYIVLSD